MIKNGHRIGRVTKKFVIHKGKTMQVSTKNNMQVWTLFKIYINSLKKHQEFTRKELLEYVYTTPMRRYETSVDIYRNNVTHLGFLEIVGRGKYKKLYDIPEKVTTTVITKAIKDKNSWREWFIPLHEKLGVNESVALPNI